MYIVRISLFILRGLRMLNKKQNEQNFTFDTLAYEMKLTWLSAYPSHFEF